MRIRALVALFLLAVPAAALLAAEGGAPPPRMEPTRFGRLTRPLEFWIPGSPPQRVGAERGALVAIAPPAIYLVDGLHLASRSEFALGDVEAVGDDEVEKLVGKMLRKANVLGALHLARDPDPSVQVVATVLGDHQLVDLGAHPEFRFYEEWLLRPGRPVYLYNEGRIVGRSRIAAYQPSAAGVGRFTLPAEDLEFHQGQRLLVSFRKLETTPIADTRKLTDLLKKPAGLETSPGTFDYELFAAVDLDRNGWNEVIVRSFGERATRFEIYERGKDAWVRIFSGGGTSR